MNRLFDNPKCKLSRENGLEMKIVSAGDKVIDSMNINIKLNELQSKYIVNVFFARC